MGASLVIQHRLRRLLLLVCGGVISIFLALAAGSLVVHDGSWTALATFHLCYFLLLALALPQPRSYFYLFFAGFLFLGFWPKVVMHLIWAPGFIDPVGDFSGTAADWDNALKAAIAGAAGLITVRLAHLLLSRYRPAVTQEEPLPPPPNWYGRFRGWIWTATLTVMVVLGFLNFNYSFYQVGVNPKIVLPYKLNVPAAWLMNVGFALWISVLVYWEHLLRSPRLTMVMLAPILEAATSSISTLSRLAYPLHTLPYFFAFFDRWAELRTRFSTLKILYLTAALLFFFVFSIYIVFWLRVHTYYQLPPEVSVKKEVHRTITFQLPNLFLQRWIGLEGVLVANSAKERGIDVFIEVITSDPKLGAQSRYQQLAKVHYFSENPQDFTFLSNAGIVGLLSFSGSLALVASGMAFIMLLLLSIESLISRFLANDFFRSVAGAFTANVLAQTTFPYLTLVFLLQLLVAIGFISGLQRINLGKAKSP